MLIVMTLHLGGAMAGRHDRALGDQCPMERTLRLIGNRTALLLIREAFYGATRFDQLWKRVGVTEAVAAQRLRDLVAAGVLAKQPYREPGQRTREEYVLTSAGHDLMPVVLGLLQWGVSHAPGGGAVAVTHVGCDAEVQSIMCCAAGHHVDESEILLSGVGRSA